MYVLAKSLREALEFLYGEPKRITILAGGTDLMVSSRDLIQGRSELTQWTTDNGQQTNPILDISRVPEMRKIRLENGGTVPLLSIGSAVTYRDAILSPLTRRYCSALVEASQRTGSIQIQNVGTLGGNVVNASPAGDALLALVALDAKVEIAYGLEQYRKEIKAFFKGPKKADLPQNHLVIRFIIPVGERYVGSSFYKLVNRASNQHGLAISVVSAAAVVKLSKDKSHVEWARLALGAVAPTPVCARQSEEILNGQPVSRDLIKEAAMAAVQVVTPIDDVRATAAYRREVLPAIVENVLVGAIRKASTG